MSLSESYSFIKKLEDYEKQLGSAIVEMLEKDAKRIEPDIKADWKIVDETLLPDRPYTTRLRNKFHSVYNMM